AEDRASGHAARIAFLAHAVAEELGLTSEERARVLNVGLLHASGVALRSESDAEAGAWVAERFGFDAQVCEAILAIDERWDGRGTPSGLTSTEIPVEALCVSA